MNRCNALLNGRRCILEVHSENTPHCILGTQERWICWGGKCKVRGLPFEESHKECKSKAENHLTQHT